MEERIICSAVWYKEIELKKQVPEWAFLPVNIKKGIVFCGHRHAQCIYSKCALTGLRDAESGESVQGFLTNKNRFVDRKEAFEIAMNQGQIIDLNQTRGKILYSEDLY